MGREVDFVLATVKIISCLRDLSHFALKEALKANVPNFPNPKRGGGGKDVLQCKPRKCNLKIGLHVSRSQGFLVQGALYDDACSLGMRIAHINRASDFEQQQ